jgi:hypothetical protein
MDRVCRQRTPGRVGALAAVPMIATGGQAAGDETGESESGVHR